MNFFCSHIFLFLMFKCNPALALFFIFIELPSLLSHLQVKSSSFPLCLKHGRVPLQSLPKAPLNKSCCVKLTFIEDYGRKLDYTTDRKPISSGIFYIINIFSRSATGNLLPTLLPPVLTFSHVIFLLNSLTPSLLFSPYCSSPKTTPSWVTIRQLLNSYYLQSK